MLQFVIAGLVLGGIYAIASAGLVITYTSSGILNFAFGAIAFFIARFYYYLHTQQNWAIAPAAVVSIVIAAPAHRRLALRRPLPLPAPVVTVDQGRGHDRSARRHPVGRHLDLRQPGDPAGARTGAGAGAGLPLPGRSGHHGPDHRLRLRRGDRGGRGRRAALHRGRPEGAGHGRLARHDRPVGHQPHGDLRRGLGGQHLLRRADGRPRRADHRPGHRELHAPHRGRRSRPSSPPGCAASRSRSASAC